MPSAPVPPYCHWSKVAITPAPDGIGRLYRVEPAWLPSVGELEVAGQRTSLLAQDRSGISRNRGCSRRPGAAWRRSPVPSGKWILGR
jgi:hypothetical protein